MPLYAYRCTQCGHRFEKIQNFSAEPELECPECHGVLERPLTAPAPQLQGRRLVRERLRRQEQRASMPPPTSVPAASRAEPRRLAPAAAPETCSTQRPAPLSLGRRHRTLITPPESLEGFLKLRDSNLRVLPKILLSRPGIAHAPENSRPLDSSSTDTACPCSIPFRRRLITPILPLSSGSRCWPSWPALPRLRWAGTPFSTSSPPPTKPGSPRQHQLTGELRLLLDEQVSIPLGGLFDPTQLAAKAQIPGAALEAKELQAVARLANDVASWQSLLQSPPARLVGKLPGLSQLSAALTASFVRWPNPSSAPFSPTARWPTTPRPSWAASAASRSASSASSKKASAPRCASSPATAQPRKTSSPSAATASSFPSAAS